MKSKRTLKGFVTDNKKKIVIGAIVAITGVAASYAIAKLIGPSLSGAKLADVLDNCDSMTLTWNGGAADVVENAVEMIADAVA